MGFQFANLNSLIKAFKRMKKKKIANLVRLHDVIWNLHGKYVDRRSGNDKWIIPSTAGFYNLHIGETWRCIKAEANYRNMQKEKKKNV